MVLVLDHSLILEFTREHEVGDTDDGGGEEDSGDDELPLQD